MLRQRFQLCRTVSRCGFRVGQEENGPVPRRSHGWQNSGTLLRVAVSVKLPANPLARRDKGGRIWSQAGQPSRSSPATTAPATPPGWATATQAILNVTNPNRRELGRSNPLALRNLSFAYQVIHGTQNIPRCEGLRQYLEGIRGKAPQLCWPPAVGQTDTSAACVIRPSEPAGDSRTASFRYRPLLCHND